MSITARSPASMGVITAVDVSPSEGENTSASNGEVPISGQDFCNYLYQGCAPFPVWKAAETSWYPKRTVQSCVFRARCRESHARELRYVHSRCPGVSDLSGSDPETQHQQLLAAGVSLSHIWKDIGDSGISGTNSRQDCRSLDSRLAQGETLVMMSIDRIGRRWLDTVGNIHDLQRHGVRIRSPAGNEQFWVQYRSADRESPESLWGYTLASFAAWVSDRKLNQRACLRSRQARWRVHYGEMLGEES